MFKFQYQNGKKRKSGKKFSALQIEAGFRDYKSGKEGLQINAALEISNRCKKITNRGRGPKSEQRDFKSGQRLQIRAIVFHIGLGNTNRCTTFRIAINITILPFKEQVIRSILNSIEEDTHRSIICFIVFSFSLCTGKTKAFFSTQGISTISR